MAVVMVVSVMAMSLAVVEVEGDSGAIGGGGLAAGGCAMSGLCCHGKNHSCSVSEKLTNVTKVTRCFCDSDCLMNGDCCHDYRNYCQPVDCAVEKKWGKWSECSVDCGMGTRNRTRNILRLARNGGKECDSTLQFGSCEGIKCNEPRLHHRTFIADRAKVKETEVAWILPMAFARWRTDVLYIRKQSPEDNGHHLGALHRSGGRKLNGHQETNTKYSAIYRMTEVGRGCNVQPIETNSSAASSWINGMENGKTVCVECQTTAAKSSLGGRCQGDGSVDMETRWVAMTFPGCHGKWLMLEKAKKKGCAEIRNLNETVSDSSNFIFV